MDTSIFSAARLALQPSDPGSIAGCKIGSIRRVRLAHAHLRVAHARLLVRLVREGFLIGIKLLNNWIITFKQLLANQVHLRI